MQNGHRLSGSDERHLIAGASVSRQITASDMTSATPSSAAAAAASGSAKVQDASHVGTMPIRIAPYGGEPELARVMELIDGELSEPYTIFTYRYFIQQWPRLCFVAYSQEPSEEDTVPEVTNAAPGVAEVTNAASGGSESQHDGTEANRVSSSRNRNRGHLSPTGSRKTPPSNLVGVVIGKLDRHLKGNRYMRGYVGMLSVEKACRGQGIASRLLRTALAAMVQQGAQEVRVCGSVARLGGTWQIVFCIDARFPILAQVVLETEADNEAALRLYESLGFIRIKRLFHYYLNGKDSFRLILNIPEEFWVQPTGGQGDASAGIEQQAMDSGQPLAGDLSPPRHALASMGIA